MKIIEISDQEKWNQFVRGLHPNTFLQSWEWGQVQEKDGEGVRYLGFFEDSEQIGAALLVTVRAKRGAFLFCPHGPLFKDEATTRQYLSTFIEYCRSLAIQEKAVALRISPLLINSPDNNDIFQKLGFHPAPLHMHTELTWVLNITPNPELLLAQMRKTTRHAITRAQKSGIHTSVVTNPQEITQRFWPLYERTKTRHGFVPYSLAFLRAQVAAFAHTASVFAVFARYENRDVAGAIIIRFGNTCFYHHGASEKLPSSLPASHSVQWYAIQEAQKQGCTHYNFWGIAPDNQPKHPFAGITVFKKGFGGYAVDYMHAQDLPLKLGYWKLWLVDTYRKVKRGF